MVRKMAYIGSSYLIGLFFASFFSCGINIFAAIGAVFVSAAALLLYGNRFVKPAVCVISVAAGMLIYGLYDFLVYENIVKYDGCDVEVKGKITEYWDYSGDKSSYIVKGVINGDVTAEVTLFTDSTSADIGDSVTLVGKASVLKDSYTFPTKSYYKAKGIYLQINGVSRFEYTPDNGFSLKRAVYGYRSHIQDVMGSIMDSESKAAMTAMLFGDKSELESSAKTLMYRSGIGHIMAVSGVHLSVLCSLVWLILSKLPINRYLRFGLLLLPIACFILLAGMSNSVLRSAVMITIVYGAELFKRRADTFNSLGIAVIILTAASPFAVRDASFLLSVAGVFGIGVAAPEVIRFIEEKHSLGVIAQSFVASCCVSAVVFPVTMLFFDEVSVMSPVSNLLLIPVCELILIGGIIVTLTGGVSFVAVPVLTVCGFLCKIVLTVSRFIGGLRFSYIPLGGEFAEITVIAAVAVVAAVFAATKSKRAGISSAAVILGLAMLFINIYRLIPDKNVTVAVLKEQSAVTAVIHDKRTASIIDLSKGGRASDSAVKYLNQNGIYRVDMVVLNDSANSAFPIYRDALELFDVGTFLFPTGEELAASGVNTDNFMTYDKNGSMLEMPRYTLSFWGNGAVLANVNNSEILLYTSETVSDKDKLYPAAVRYKGTKHENDVNTKILAVMSGSAEIELGKTVYIGENVKLTAGADGSVRSDIIK